MKSLSVLETTSETELGLFEMETLLDPIGPQRVLSGCVHLGGALELQHGMVHDVEVAYEMVGPPNAPLVMVQGGISSSCHIAPNARDPSPGWWEDMVGPGRPIDTRRFRVLSFDFLGGAGKTTCREQESSAGLSWLLPRDQAKCFMAALDILTNDPPERPLGQRDGESRNQTLTFVGASYGAMIGMALAEADHPRLEGLVAICAAHRSHPMATALRSLQRHTVRLGICSGREREGLSLARGLGITTYRSAFEFAKRFSVAPKRTDQGPLFPVEEYLSNRGQEFSNRFSARAFLTLSESIDLHDVDPKQIRVPVTLIGFSTDILVPGWQLRELAGLLDRGEFVMIESNFGHDGFLKEIDQVGSVIRSVLGSHPRSVEVL